MNDIMKIVYWNNTFFLKKDKPLQGLRVSPSGACGGMGGAHDGAEPHTVLRKVI
jgi:hypothetical protein